MRNLRQVNFFYKIIISTHFCNLFLIS